MIAEHHASRRYGHVLADLESFEARSRFAACIALHVFNRALHSMNKITSTRAYRLIKQVRVGGDKIGRRHHIQHLPCDKRYRAFCGLGQTR